MWDTINAALRGKFIIINKKSERSQINHPVMHVVIKEDLTRFPEVLKNKQRTLVFSVFLEELSLLFCIVTKPALTDMKEI